MGTHRTQTVAEQIPQPSGASKDASRLTHEESYYATPIDLSTDASTTVSSVPALLMGVYVNTVLSAHLIEIQDNATTIITIPASTAAGTMIRFPGLRFETSIVVNPNDSSTGNITVMYRPI